MPTLGQYTAPHSNIAFPMRIITEGAIGVHMDTQGVQRELQKPIGVNMEMAVSSDRNRAGNQSVDILNPLQQDVSTQSRGFP